MIPDPQTPLTALDLLRLYLELRSLTPNLDDWTEEAMERNPPRLLRLRQLKALFSAFEISWNPAAFEAGRFIDHEDPAHESLLELARLEMRFEQDSVFGPRAHSMSRVFERAFRYRLAADSVLRFNAGVIETSGLYHFSEEMMEKVNAALRDNLHFIEDMMVAMIDPRGRYFKIKRLVRDFEYPNADLHDIDSDWA